MRRPAQRRRIGRLAVPVLTVLAMLGASGYLVRQIVRHPPQISPAVNLDPGGNSPPLAGTVRRSGSGVPAPPYVGFSVAGFPPDFTRLQKISSLSGTTPNIVSMYQRLGAPFNAAAAADIASIGALPLVQVDPDQIGLGSIASGAQDKLLTAYAQQVRGYGGPVAIGFAHEFNGPWYRWSFKKVTPAVFVAAWRHIHDLFARLGARNVIWVWTVNRDNKITTPLRPYWPGDAYVNWVGLDGYFFSWSPAFAGVFGPSVSDVRSFTKRPILITETGISPTVNRVARIQGLFAGAAKARAEGVIGVIWFDYSRVAGHDWRIDGDPTALSAFRKYASIYRTGHA